MVNHLQASVTSSASQSTTPPFRQHDDNRCPECNARADEDPVDGSEYCPECGLVLSTVPLERTEPWWQPRSERRAGPATAVSRVSVGTKIGAGENPRKAAQLNRFNNRLEYQTRALKEGLQEVCSICSACDLPTSTEEHAAYRYRQAFDESLLQGRSQEGIAAACVYVATRRYSQPVTMSDIEDVCPVSQSEISGAYRTILQELEIGVQPPDPGDFLARIAANAEVSYQVERRAGELLRHAIGEQQHIGQNPVGVAAAALYAAARELDNGITQDAIADAANVGSVTISRQWQTFAEYIE